MSRGTNGCKSIIKLIGYHIRDEFAEGGGCSLGFTYGISGEVDGFELLSFNVEAVVACAVADFIKAVDLICK
jgi:hypothetical protein